MDSEWRSQNENGISKMYVSEYAVSFTCGHDTHIVILKLVLRINVSFYYCSQNIGTPRRDIQLRPTILTDNENPVIRAQTQL